MSVCELVRARTAFTSSNENLINSIVAKREDDTKKLCEAATRRREAPENDELYYKTDVSVAVDAVDAVRA